MELEDVTTITKCKGYLGKLDKTQYLGMLKGESLDLTVTRWDRSLAEVCLVEAEAPPLADQVKRKNQKRVELQT